MSHFRKILTVGLLISWLFCFEVVDDGSIFELKSGETKVKYVTLYNFDKTAQVVLTELKLVDWPNKRKPEYQIDLAAIQTEQCKLPSGKKILFPVYLNAYTRLEKGLYIYWLELTSVIGETSQNNTNYRECQAYHLPLIIKVN